MKLIKQLLIALMIGLLLAGCQHKPMATNRIKDAPKPGALQSEHIWPIHERIEC